MTWHLWGLFVVAVFFLSGTPGPNMLHILSRSVQLGVRGATPAMAGCMLALILILSASAVGLTALLMALPGAFTVLRYVGTAYLLWLGIKAWRARVEDEGEAVATIDASLSTWQIFRGGFTIAISNPKALLFAAAFLPQFVSAAAPKGPQFVILVATFTVIEVSWYFTYALGGRQLARHLRRPSLKRWFNRVTGSVFVGFGALLWQTRAA